MFILRDLLVPLQEEFSKTEQGQKRKVWFAYTLLAVVIPFTSSITSNLLRALQLCLAWIFRVSGFTPLWRVQRCHGKGCGKPCGE